MSFTLFTLFTLFYCGLLLILRRQESTIMDFMNRLPVLE